MDKYNLTTYDEDDDLYSGFNEFHPTLNTASLIQESKDATKNPQLPSTLQVYQIAQWKLALDNVSKFPFRLRSAIFKLLFAALLYNYLQLLF